MRLFSKSLAIGLPASRVGIRKDGSCPSVSDRLNPPTFPTLSKDITLVMQLFSKSLAIGLPATRVGVRKDGSCPSVSDRLDPPTFPTLCKDITLVMRLFSKSLAIGLRLVGSVQTLDDPTQFGCIGQPSTFTTLRIRSAEKTNKKMQTLRNSLLQQRERTSYSDSKSVFSTRKLAVLGCVIEEGIIHPDPE